MAKPNRKLNKAIKKFSDQKQEVIVPIQGTLGMPIGGQKLVEVPNRAGFVYVKLRDNTSEFIQAYNSEVSTIYGLPVLVARQNNIYKVIGRDQDRYKDWSNIPYLPKHGGQHSFNQALGMGADIVWVYSQQLMPLLGYPSGTNGANNIIIAPYTIRDLNGNWKYVGNTGTPDITMYRPSTTGAVMVLVYIDTVSGNPYLLVGSGTTFYAGLTGTSDIVPYIPKLTNPNGIPDVAVRLTSGTTQLFWSNLYDVRPFLQVIPTGTSGGGGGSGTPLTIWDEGISQGTATILNVVGAVADISVSGTVAKLSISSGNSAIVEDLTSQISGTQTRFRLTNSVSSNGILLLYNGLAQEYGVHFLVSGTFVDTLFTPASGSTLQAVEMGMFATGSSASLAIQDEGVAQGTATTMNFVGAGVQASVSGSTATILITGSSDRTLIAEVTPSATGTITVASGISSSYKKLTLEFAVASTQAANAVDGYLRFNGDTTPGNYRYQLQAYNPFGLTNANGANYLFASAVIPGTSAPSGSFGIGTIDIIQYANTNMSKIANIQISSRYDAVSVFIQSMFGGMLWSNFSAINRIDVGVSAGNFTNGSVIRLYGET